MKKMRRIVRTVHLFFLVGVFLSVPALAGAKGPSWKDDEKFEKKQQKQYRKSDRHERGGGKAARGRKGAGYGKKSNYEESGSARKMKKNASLKKSGAKGKKARAHFRDKDREMLHAYFSRAYRSGHCPPGLAKKKNGCMPRGARKWRLGQQLPREVVFHNLPPEVEGGLEPPPPKHRYVRVASDILLITMGTGMVVDALEDLGRVLDQ